AEDIHQNGFDVRIGQNQFERNRDLILVCAAAHIQKVGGFLTGQLDNVHRRHGETGAVDHAADIAVELDVVEARLGRGEFDLVFFRLVAQRHHIRVAEQRVVVEVDL